VHRWAIEILGTDGKRFGQRAIQPDFSPLSESARLAYVRQHGPSAAADYDRPVEITPIWQPKLGDPYVGGLRIAVEGQPLPHPASTAIFRASASEVAAGFVESGLMQEGAKFVYLVTAYTEDSDHLVDQRPTSRIRVSSLPVGVQVSDGVWPKPASITPEESATDLGVTLPRRVLDDISALTESKRGVETGGVLLGHLRWDSKSKDLFLEITEHIHARGAIGDSARLRFTPECWAEIRGAVALRQRGEAICGWWHSHCGRTFCVECPPERQATCLLQSGFLSDHDKILHRTVFPRAFMTALVATDSVLGDIRFAMFGWQNGVLEKRGYRVTGEDSLSAHAGYELVAGPERAEGAIECEHPKSTSSSKL
jgi:hypothetical protein